MVKKVEIISWLVLLLLLICNPSNNFDPTSATVANLMAPINNVLKASPVSLLDSAPLGFPPLSGWMGYRPFATRPSIQDARYYTLHAFAAYCPDGPLRDFNCELCRQIGSDVRFVTIVEDTRKLTETSALITVNDARREIVIAFRGSLNLANVIVDVTMIPNGNIPGPPNVRVHQGFNIAIQSLYDPIVAEVTKLLEKHPDYSIKVVGHSLGGALAVLAVYLFKVKMEFPPWNQISLFTYGQPRVGNKVFVDYMNSLDIAMVRVTNKDIIPHLVPAQLGYVHAVHELFIDENRGPRYCNSDVYEDSHCSNFLGPVYDPVEHFHYFGKTSAICVEESPISFAMQLKIPTQKIIRFVAPHADFETVLKPLREGFTEVRETVGGLFHTIL